MAKTARDALARLDDEVDSLERRIDGALETYEGGTFRFPFPEGLPSLHVRGEISKRYFAAGWYVEWGPRPSTGACVALNPLSAHWSTAPARR